MQGRGKGREGTGIKEGEGGDGGALCGKVLEIGGEEVKKRRNGEGGNGRGSTGKGSAIAGTNPYS